MNTELIGAIIGLVTSIIGLITAYVNRSASAGHPGQQGAAPAVSSYVARQIGKWLVIGGLLLALVMLFLALVGSSFMNSAESAKRKEAKAQVDKLSQSLTVYMISESQYPQSLEMMSMPLLSGRAPLVEPRDLIDPWGQPYLYDPNDIHPTTGIPKIWSLGPKPGSAGSEISNRDVK